MRVHESVVVHHGRHEAGGEAVAGEERDGRHGVSRLCTFNQIFG